MVAGTDAIHVSRPLLTETFVGGAEPTPALQQRWDASANYLVGLAIRRMLLDCNR